MKDIIIQKKWKITKKFLEDFLKDTPYKMYLKPVEIKDTNINCIYKRLLFHAQNSGRKRNIIKFREYEQQYNDALFNFNPIEVNLKSDIEIKKRLKKYIPIYIETKNNNELGAIKQGYIRTIKESAKFLQEFDNTADFINYCHLIINKKGKNALLSKIQKIYGFGIALSSDFFKELDRSFNCYAKPDVHITHFISEIFNCDCSEKAVIEKIDEISSITNDKQYEIDKLIYLACTYDFYLHKKTRQELIKEINSKIKNEV